MFIGLLRFDLCEAKYSKLYPGYKTFTSRIQSYLLDQWTTRLLRNTFISPTAPIIKATSTRTVRGVTLLKIDSRSPVRGRVSGSIVIFAALLPCILTSGDSSSAKFVMVSPGLAQFEILAETVIISLCPGWSVNPSTTIVFPITVAVPIVVETTCMVSRRESNASVMTTCVSGIVFGFAIRIV